MGMEYHRFLRGRSFVRPLRHSFLRDPSRKEGHGERRYPVCMPPSPRSLVSVTGVNLKKSFFFLAFLAELAYPKSRCMADGRQLVEAKKGKHVFVYSAVPERR